LTSTVIHNKMRGYFRTIIFINCDASEIINYVVILNKEYIKYLGDVLYHLKLLRRHP